MQEQETSETEPSYESIRVELEAFLPSVGQKVLQLRHSAETDPNFVRLKADKTIVTKADELSEDLIRGWIEEHFPEDTIRGEEREQKQGGARSWIVDPIDGTYNFNNLGNRFSISVGLIENNIPKVGILFYPAEDISISASEGMGASINGIALETSKGETQLDKAKMIIGEPTELPQYFSDARFKEAIEQQASLVSQTRHELVGMSYTFAFLRFLQENTDAILHFGVAPHDVAAVAAIARELKLEVSGYDGKPLDFTKNTVPTVISKNSILHEDIIKRLNSRS